MNDSYMMPTYKRSPVSSRPAGERCSLTPTEGIHRLSRRDRSRERGPRSSRTSLRPSTRKPASSIHVSNLFETGPQEELPARLVELTDGMQSVLLQLGGRGGRGRAEARPEARGSTGRDATRFICAEGGFHGRTFGALSATGQPSKQAPFAPLVDGFTHVPFGDIAALEEAMDEDVAAVLLEPIQGEAGVVVPPTAIWRRRGHCATAWALC